MPLMTLTRSQNGIGRIVETARLRPGACMLTGRGDGPFIDFNKDFHGGHEGRMYLRVQAALDIGRLVGMSSTEEVDALKAELAEAQERIATIGVELDAAISELDAIELIENRGFRIRRRTQTAAVAA